MPHRPLACLLLALLSLSWARGQDSAAPPRALAAASVFGAHMVLPAGTSIPVWGMAPPGATVRATFGDASESATAAPDGRWRCELPARPASAKPERLVITCEDQSLTYEDVLVGEVWLCSGQSNMEWPLSQSDGGADEFEDNDRLPIRMFKVAHATSEKRLDTCLGKRAAPQGRKIADWSAVAWHFARTLHSELGVPIGLIQSTWGGTPAEAWTSEEALRADPLFADILQRAKIPSKAPQNQASRLFNAMIAPLAGFPVRGVIWYQGESNVAQAWQYRSLFPALIRDWRAHWHNDALPFYFVQIAPWKYPKEGSPAGTAAAELREAQALTAKSVPHTAMVPTLDVGNPVDIHPRDKRTVGTRLALVALADVYRRGETPAPPAYAGHELREDSVAVRISGKELRTRDGKPPSEFQIAGADRNFVAADARIEGTSVIVRAEAVKQPVAVRFAFTDAAQPNLIGADGLPALPFRTDDWPVSTQPPAAPPAK